MIAFFDTSALVKLYIAEDDSELVRGTAEAAALSALCRIAWAEAVAALARRGREHPEDAKAIEAAKRHLALDWPSWFVIEVSQPVVEAAGELADAFALRAYDSVQLAAALSLRRSTGDEFLFVCFDSRLRKAARALDMATSPQA